MIKNFVKTVLITTLGFSTVSVADVNICTGSEGGGYETLGHYIKGNLPDKDEVNIMNTNGSVENIEMFNEGECQIAVVQVDALSLFKPNEPYKSKRGYREMVYWFYNKEHGVENMGDISKGQSIVVIQGSGSEVTLRNIATEDTSYMDHYQGRILAEDFYDAADIASEGFYEGAGGKVDVVGFLYVTRPADFPDDMVTDFSNTLSIGEVVDKDFNDFELNGEPLYEFCEISKDNLRGMSKPTFGNPDTICMDSRVIYTKDGIGKFSKRDVRKAINRAVQ